MKDNILLVFCTVANQQEARKISNIIINKKLAACCTFIPTAVSIYSWKGNIEESSESLLLIKTAKKKYEQLEKEIKMIHSYSVPEIIATRIESGSQAYIDWIYESIESES